MEFFKNFVPSAVRRTQCFNLLPPPEEPSGGGGGGAPSNPPAKQPNATPPVNPALLPYVGALTGGTSASVIPVWDAVNNCAYLAIIDPTNFDCEEDVEYHFKIEEIEEGRKGTINRLRIRYRDLGVCTIIATIDGENGPLYSEVLSFGGRMDGKIRTVYGSPITTDLNQQLKIKRLANKGPMALCSVTLCGVEGDGPQL